MEESLVIAQVRTGNAGAFAAIVEHYQPPIQRYLYRLTGDYELAKDLAQDTFIQAFRRIMITDSQLTVRAWLYGIATKCAQQSRRRARLLSFLPLDGRERDCSAAVTYTDRTDENMAIGEALCRVPRDQRVCLVLHFVEGFKYREIGQILDISEEAVRKRVARGKREFRRHYTLKEE